MSNYFDEDDEMDFLSNSDLPWKSANRQQKGRDYEKKVARQNQMRRTPMSGAGSIKGDGITEDEVIELKHANKSYTLNVKDLQKVRLAAINAGKEPIFVVHFDSENLTAIIRLSNDPKWLDNLGN